MNQKTRKQLTHWLSVIIIGITLGFALQFVRAWTEPTEAPPGGNLGAPINTGATAQTKTGNLNVNGGMLIGSSTTGGNKGAGTINANKVCIQGVCNTEWPTGGTTTTGGDTTPEPPCECGPIGSWPTMPCGSTANIIIGTSEWCAIEYLCTYGSWTQISECH
jgi:hypothetical protein